MPSKSKKYSRKRNYRKRRHSRRMQRKSRSRNAYAYNRRRRTMFGGAPNGKYNVTADKLEGTDDKTSHQNSENGAVLLLLKSMAYLDGSANNEFVSTDKFNKDFQTESINIVKFNEKDYTVTVTPDGDNYKVNVKAESTSHDDTGINGNVTFTKVNASIIYSVVPFDAGNDSNTSNQNALNKLVELGYVFFDSEFNRYVTSKKFVDIIDDKFKKGDQKELTDDGIALQQVGINGNERKIEVHNTQSAIIIGYVILTSLSTEENVRIQGLYFYNCRRQ